MGQVNRSQNVDAENPFQRLLGMVEEERHWARTELRSVVDEKVDASESVEGPLRDPFRDFGNVACDRQHFGVAHNLLAGTFERFCVACVDDQRVAASGELPRQRKPETFGRTGDEYDAMGVHDVMIGAR